MKLRDWMIEHNMGNADVAAACGVHPVSVIDWAKDRATPRPKHMRALVRLTKGAVTASDFPPRRVGRPPKTKGE